MMTSAPSSTAFRLAAFALAIGALFVVLRFGLLPGLLAGLAAYTITRSMAGAGALARTGRMAPQLAATVVVLLPVLALTVAGVELSQFVATAAQSIGQLRDHLVTVVVDWRTGLPAGISKHIPVDRAELEGWLAGLVQSQVPLIAGLGRTWAQGLLLVVVGIIVGALAAASSVTPSDRPLATELRGRARALQTSFRQIVVAQFWIASINTLATAAFLYGALPAFKVHMPYAPGLVLLTFVAGMLPIVGNLICNVVLTITGLSMGPHVALACLLFLIAVHKAEYVINARVIGGRISTAAWELIVAMFVLETLFGVAGLVAAPLYYAWLKLELKSFGWV